MAKRKQRATGRAVDATGGPVVDPTDNVLQLVDAESLRQDGLRQAGEAGIRREMAIRAEYDEKLRRAEKDRIDAIRAVDQGQIQRAAEVQATAALALQAQVVASAEAVRTQQGAFAQSFTDALANAVKPLADSIATLQAQQWKDFGGRQQVVEQRDVRGETRLNLGAVFGGISILLVIVFGVASLWVKHG